MIVRNSEVKLHIPEARENRDIVYTVKEDSFLFCTGSKVDPNCVSDKGNGSNIMYEVPGWDPKKENWIDE